MTDEATASEPAQRGRRRLTAVIITVGVLVVGAIVAVVVTISDGAQPSRYSSLPQSCGLLSAATLAAFTPDATWSTVAVAPVPGAKQNDACVWTSGGQPARMIFVGVALFTSAAKAQRTSASDIQQFRTTVALAPAIRSVPGLGDQAIEVSSTGLPPVGVGGPDVRDTSLVVISGNVIISAQYVITRSSGTLPAGFPAQASDEVAIARDVLAVLATPRLAGHAPRSSSPLPGLAPPAPSEPPGPDYAGPRNACTLPSAAVLAKYEPGATVEPASTPSSRPGTPLITQCTWISLDTGSTFLTVTVFPENGSDGSVPIPGAQNSYDSDLQWAEKPFTADSMTTTPIGTRPVTGLGQQATAVFQKETGSLIGTTYGIELVLWSGNAEIEVIVEDLATTRAQPAQLAAGVAIARSVLAALPRAKR